MLDESKELMLLVLAICVPIMVILMIILILILIYKQCHPSRYQLVTKPLDNTVVLDMSSKSGGSTVTGTTYLGDSSTQKDTFEDTYSGSGAGLDLRWRKEKCDHDNLQEILCSLREVSPVK